MKQLLLALLVAWCGTALADGSQVLVTPTWSVTVTLSYINEKVKPVMDVPVMDVLVREGVCVKGKTRTEKMIPKEIPVTQEICVERNSGGRAVIRGWVFATERIVDAGMPGDRGAKTRGELNYGVPVDMTTDGTFVRWQSGPYTITASQPKPI